MTAKIQMMIWSVAALLAFVAGPAVAQTVVPGAASTSKNTPIILAQNAKETPEQRARRLKRERAAKQRKLQRQRQRARQQQQQRQKRAQQKRAQQKRAQQKRAQQQKQSQQKKRLAPSQVHRAREAAKAKEQQKRKRQQIIEDRKRQRALQQKRQQQRLKANPNLQKQRQQQRLRANQNLQKDRQKQRLRDQRKQDAATADRQRRLDRLRRERQENRQDLQKQRARTRDRLQDQRQEKRAINERKQNRLQADRARDRAALAKRRQVQRRRIQRDNQKYRALADRRQKLRRQINRKQKNNLRVARRRAAARRQATWLRNQRRRDAAFRRARRDFAFRERARVVKRRNDRVVYTALAAGALIGAAATTAYFIHHNDDRRIDWRSDDYYAEDLNNGWTRSVVVRADGSRVVTVRDGSGFIVRRYRVYPGNRVTVLYDNQPSWWQEGDIDVVVDPVRYSGPRDRYIVEPSRVPIETVYDTITAEPVAEVGRYYTLNQILVNNDLRGYMPRIDLDTITFASGSAEIPTRQIDKLEEIGTAMEEAIKENPNEVFLIEGHTDATGDKIDNLDLSDRRASSVANTLTEYFDIPPENLVTQGYGEQFLKVPTSGPESRNRRVAIRRITPLLATESDKIALDSSGNEIFETE
ncbi:MAG: OmpA family protein [Filomicrobium sp.]